MDWMDISLRLLMGLAAALGTVFLCYCSVKDNQCGKNAFRDSGELE